MNKERMVILRLLEEGKITAEEADKLLAKISKSDLVDGDINQKINELGNAFGEFAKEVGSKLDEMSKKVGPKVKESAKIIIGKTSEAIGEISKEFKGKKDDNRDG